MPMDNPASRLVEVLKKARSIKNPHSITCRAGWRNVLDLNEDIDDAELMMRIASVMSLPKAIDHLMRDHLKNVNWKGECWWQCVQKAFAEMNQTSNFSTFTNILSDAAIAELGMFAMLLHSHSQKELLEKEQIKNLMESLISFKIEIIESELTQTLKSQILKYLNKIITALEEYYITGGDTVIDAVESAIGHLAFSEEYRNSIKSDGLGKKFIAAISTVANVMTVATGIPQMSPFVNLLLDNFKK